MALTGNLATVAFSGGISFSGGSYTRAEFEGESIEPLEDSDLSTTDYMSYVPGDLKDTPSVTLTHWNVPGVLPPIGTVGTLTITYRQETGQTTPASLTMTGFITSAPPGQIANNELQQSTITFKADGQSDPVYTPAS